MRRDEVSAAGVAGDLGELGEIAPIPQNRIAAATTDGRHNDACAFRRLEGADEAVDHLGP